MTTLGLSKRCASLVIRLLDRLAIVISRPQTLWFLALGGTHRTCCMSKKWNNEVLWFIILDAVSCVKDTCNELVWATCCFCQDVPLGWGWSFWTLIVKLAITACTCLLIIICLTCRWWYICDLWELDPCSKDICNWEWLQKKILTLRHKPHITLCCQVVEWVGSNELESLWRNAVMV